MAITASIIGSTGYTGEELTKLLIAHSKVEKILLASKSNVDLPIDPKYHKVTDKIYSKYLDYNDNLLFNSDVIFFATPNGVAQKFTKPFYDKEILIIDLSADFRLKNPNEYKKWYGNKHTQSELLNLSCYGLSEIYKSSIAKSRLIANPGCYATAIQLGLYPLIKNKIIQLSNIVVDAKSGVSGAGRKIAGEYLFCEVNENIRAYAISGHRHYPEMIQTLQPIADEPIDLTFIPHLIPMQRGILATIYANSISNITSNQIKETFLDCYENTKFVRVLKNGETPNTANVVNTNFCDLGIHLIENSKKIIVTSAIDNMVKGAAGQAIQNMNIALGFDESEGLI